MIKGKNRQAGPLGLMPAKVAVANEKSLGTLAHYGQ